MLICWVEVDMMGTRDSVKCIDFNKRLANPKMKRRGKEPAWTSLAFDADVRTTRADDAINLAGDVGFTQLSTFDLQLAI